MKRAFCMGQVFSDAQPYGQLVEMKKIGLQDKAKRIIYTTRHAKCFNPYAEEQGKSPLQHA